VLPVRSDVPPPVVAHPAAVAAMPKRRLSILPPGERERRRDRPDRRKADRRKKNLGAPYGAERRSGEDDHQADRRSGANRAVGIGLMRDYFAQDDGRAPRSQDGVPSRLVVRFRD
jgi:hypothetical protein